MKKLSESINNKTLLVITNKQVPITHSRKFKNHNYKIAITKVDKNADFEKYDKNNEDFIKKYIDNYFNKNKLTNLYVLLDFSDNFYSNKIIKNLVFEYLKDNRIILLHPNGSEITQKDLNMF